ncbi:MAG: hypothetical protein GY711_12185 [bacterium]|nr:hypothetical protein [bacterium]
MTRLVLSFFVSTLVLAIGIFAAWFQARNFAKAADLDELQRESEWFERRKSRLREDIERFEFEYLVEQNRRKNEQPLLGGRQ